MDDVDRSGGDQTRAINRPDVAFLSLFLLLALWHQTVANLPTFGSELPSIPATGHLGAVTPTVSEQAYP